MAITLNGTSSTGSTTDGTLSLSPSAPTGMLNTDWLMAHVMLAVDSAQTWTAPTGWTLLRESANPGGTFPYSRLATFAKRATNAEPGSYTFSWTATIAGQGFAVAVIAAWANVAFVEAHNGTQVDSSTTVACPAVTTLGANRQIVCAYGAINRGSWTPPTGMTERADVVAGGTVGYSVAAPTAFYPTVSFSDVLQVAAGSTGTKTATYSGSSYPAGQTFALVEAVDRSGAAII